MSYNIYYVKLYGDDFYPFRKDNKKIRLLSTIYFLKIDLYPNKELILESKIFGNSIIIFGINSSNIIFREVLYFLIELTLVLFIIYSPISSFGMSSKSPEKNKEILKSSLTKLKTEISKLDVSYDKYLNEISKTKGKYFTPRYSLINSIEKSMKSLNENFLKSREIYDEKIKLDELELVEHKKALEAKNKNDDLIDSYIDSLK